MSGALIDIGKVLTMYITLPIVALLLLTLIGVMIRDKEE